MLDTCPPYKHNASQARYNLTRFADSKYCGLSKLFLRQRWGKISGFARGRAGESFRSDMDPLFSGWSGAVYTQNWALWNKSPVHMERIQVRPRDGYADAFLLYASDEPLDFRPRPTCRWNPRKHWARPSFSYRRVNPIFLMIGNNRSIWLNHVDLEYYH